MIGEALRAIIKKGMEFYEKHARLFYRLLNHCHSTELRFLKRNHYPAFQIVKNEEEFVKACIAWNGKRNIYAGIRDRASGIRNCATATEIIGLQTVVLDIDPIRESELPSTDEELQRSIEASREISEWFEEKGFKKPYLAVTGNGTSLYFSTPFLDITSENRDIVISALQHFEEEMRKTFKKLLKEKNCRIDSMYDLPRVAKVIGTKSVKGEEKPGRPWRCSFWIEEPLERRVDEKLLNFILDYKVSTRPNFIKKGDAQTPLNYPESEIPFSGPVWLMQPIPDFGEKLQGDWIWEPKIDGWRMQILIREKGVEFWGRRLERKPDWTERLKGVKKEGLSEVPPGTILDCELYCEKGRRFIPSLFTQNPKGKPIVLVFDIIFLNFEFVGNRPLIERKELLSSFPLKEPFNFL